MSGFLALVKADYLQRTRNYAFLVTLVVSVYFAYILVPAPGANYKTVSVGDFIGVQNSAWVGHVTAVMSSVFLWIIGFYLINNGIKRDIETGVGQIVATTGVSNFNYLFAKAFSNFLVLFTIMLIVLLMGVGVVLVRGANEPFNWIQFLFPFLFSTLPAIFCVSVVAVIGEVFLGRYPTLLNIAFFMLVNLLLARNVNSASTLQPYFDVFGVKYLTNQLAEVVNNEYSKTEQLISVGFQIGKQHTKVFSFTGSSWSPLFVLSRILWVAFSFVLLLIASMRFHRFDLKDIVSRKSKRKAIKEKVKDEEVLLGKYGVTDEDLLMDKLLESAATEPKEIRLTELPAATSDLSMFPFLKTELLLLFRRGPKWFWLISIGGFIALIFIPLPIAHKFGLPLLWFLQINRWATIATKEKEHGTHYFTYAAYQPLKRLFTSQILAAVLLSLGLALPLIVRYMVNGEFLAAISVFTGAVFLIACSVFLGVVSGKDRIFNILFFMVTYANLNAVPALDYFGAVNSGSIYMGIMGGSTLLLFVIAYLWRGYEIKNQ